MYDHVTGQGADSSFSPRAAADHVGACREHGQRPAKAPPSIEGGGSRVFPKGYRSFTPEMVLETLRKHGPSTRIEMFEAVFGPDNLRDCGNPSSYLHKAIQVLVPGRIVECGHRNGSKVYRLAQQTPPLPAGLFTADRPAPCPLIPSPEPTGASASSFEASRVNHPAPADEHSPTSDCIAASQDATDPTIREEARRFVEISGRAFLSIPYRETDEAEALVAGIFADPTAPLIEQALVVGWRADLAEMAFASSPERRALRFAGLDIAKAEAAFGEIVSGHGLAIGEHAAAMRVVIDALSGAAAPSVTGKAWIEDAFATLRMPPPASPVSTAPSRPSQPGLRRREEPRMAFVPRNPSQALKALALRSFKPDSPAGQIMVRYAPLVRALFDGGHTAAEIAQTFVDEGMQIPVDMAVALVERLRTTGT